MTWQWITTHFGTAGALTLALAVGSLAWLAILARRYHAAEQLPNAFSDYYPQSDPRPKPHHGNKAPTTETRPKTLKQRTDRWPYEN